MSVVVMKPWFVDSEARLWESSLFCASWTIDCGTRKHTAPSSRLVCLCVTQVVTNVKFRNIYELKNICSFYFIRHKKVYVGLGNRTGFEVVVYVTTPSST